MRYLCLALSFFMFSGCGLRGKLERPPPLWGKDQKAKAEKAHTPSPNTSTEGTRKNPD